MYRNKKEVDMVFKSAQERPPFFVVDNYKSFNYYLIP